MENRLTNSVPELKDKLGQAIPAVVKYTVTLGLAAGLGDALTQILGELTTADNAFEQGKLDGKAATRALKSVKQTARAHATLARDLFKRTFGSRYNQDWDAVGFNGSTRVPATTAGLLEVLSSMAAQLTAHPDLGSAELKITAEETNTLHEDLSSAQATANLNKANRAQFSKTRAEKAVKGRRLLRSLVYELERLMDSMDPRWLEFGFNRPGADEIPDVPENVTAALTSTNAVVLQWTAAPRAEHYRVWKKVSGVDQEFVAVGSTPGVDFVIEGLPANATIEIAVSAVNNGGESQRSAVVTVVTQ